MISFGESVAETFSHPNYRHARQEQELTLASYASQNCGELGFRFVKIENLESFPVELQGISGRYIHRDLSRCGSFTSSDELLNRIWDTSAYTIELCCQSFIWDGIKRDRLVWMGDLFIELIAASAVFGRLPLVEKSMDFVRDESPLPRMMNNCVTYSMWWILAQAFWYQRFGALDYLQRQKEYLFQLLQFFADKVGGDGRAHLEGNGFLLLDWATDANEANRIDILSDGCHAILLMAFREGAKLSEILGNEDMARLCREKAVQMAQIKPELHSSMSGNAFQVLSGLWDAKEVYQKSFDGKLPHGMSTFLGCFVLDAVVEAGHLQKAVELMKQYWGGMLNAGATTFWEHFEVDWIKNAARIDEIVPPGKHDLHGEYGSGCFKSYRNSFCHGWSAMPAEWLVRNICGIKFLDANTITFEPNLCGLDFVEAAIPAKNGEISVKITKEHTDIQLSEGITILHSPDKSKKA